MSFNLKIRDTISSENAFKNAMAVMEELGLAERLRSEVEKAFTTNSGTEIALSEEEVGGVIRLIISHSGEQSTANS